jgi:hypothetical protein
MSPEMNQAFCILIASPLMALLVATPLRADDVDQIQPIVMFTLDPDATHYGTFQSHNQKVAANKDGIFTTHIRTRNDAYTAQQWRLSRSTDGGRTFTTLHEATHATQASPIEIDADGTLHMVRVDFLDGNAYHYRFSAKDNFASPVITKVTGAAAGKHSMVMDQGRQQLYFFAHNNTFHVLGLDGSVKRSVTLITDGPHAILQYPLLAMADDGTLVAAWTTVKKDAYLYWDIHAIRSSDGGETWTTLAGKDLSVPIIADDTGPADLISSTDEFTVHTWLANLIVAGGKIHMVYQAQSQPPKSHYVRYDLASGRRDAHQQPTVGGKSHQFASLDGFFTKDDQRLFLTTAFQGRLVSMMSTDWGLTWTDFAAGPVITNPLYATGGYRNVTPDGMVVGTVTEMTHPSLDSSSQGAVHFFRFQASSPSTPKSSTP